MQQSHSIDLSYSYGGALARVVFSNGKGNILTTALLSELAEAIRNQSDEKHLKLIVLEGKGVNFSYGASIQEHAPEAIAEEMRTLRSVILAIADSPVPVAVLVRGYCLGGGFELVLPCHFTFAAGDSVFGFPEIKLGVYPPVACALLPRMVPQQVADRLVITGEEASANQMQAWGLVHSVFERENLSEEVDAWFEASLAKLSASSLRHVTRAGRKPMLNGLNDAIEALEDDYVHRLLLTKDAQEGVSAFLEKRLPQWLDQ